MELKGSKFLPGNPAVKEAQPPKWSVPATHPAAPEPLRNTVLADALQRHLEEVARQHSCMECQRHFAQALHSRVAGFIHREEKASFRVEVYRRPVHNNQNPYAMGLTPIVEEAAGHFPVGHSSMPEVPGKTSSSARWDVIGLFRSERETTTLEANITLDLALHQQRSRFPEALGFPLPEDYDGRVFGIVDQFTGAPVRGIRSRTEPSELYGAVEEIALHDEVEIPGIDA